MFILNIPFRTDEIVRMRVISLGRIGRRAA